MPEETHDDVRPLPGQTKEALASKGVPDPLKNGAKTLVPSSAVPGVHVGFMASRELRAPLKNGADGNLLPRPTDPTPQVGVKASWDMRAP